MKIVCSGCAASYNVDDDRIPPEGMKATCPKCLNSWVVNQDGTSGPSLPTTLPTPAASAVPATEDMPPPADNLYTEPDAPDADASALGGSVPDFPMSPPKPTKARIIEPQEQQDEDVLTFAIAGKTIELPNNAATRLLTNPIVLGVGVLVLVLLTLSIFKVIGFSRDLAQKGAGFGQVDIGAVRVADLWSNTLPLKDEIVASGTFDQNFSDGLKALRRGTYGSLKEGELSFRRAAKLKKNNDLTLALLAQTYALLIEYLPEQPELRRLGKLRLDRAVQLNAQLPEVLRAQGEFEVLDRNFGEAKAKVQKAIEAKPNDALNYLSLCHVEKVKGLYEEAKKAAAKAIELDRELVPAHAYFAFFEDRDSNYKSAQAAYEEALRLDPGHPLSWLGLAEIKIERFNQIDDSVSFLISKLNDSIKDAHPREMAMGKYLLARAMEKSGNVSGALEKLKESRDDAPKMTRLIIYEALLKQMLDPMFKGEEFVESAVKEDMRDKDYFLYKGQREAGRGNFSPAIEYFNKVVTLDPNHARAFYELGMAYQSNGDNSNALQSFEKSLKADAGFGDSYVRLATLQLEKKNYTEAMRLLEEANSRNDRIASVHNLMGVVHLRQNNLEQSLAELQKSVEIDPRYAEAYRNLAEFFLAKEDGVNAQKYADQAKGIEPQNISNLFLYAKIYEKTNQIPKALSIYDELIKREPKNVQVLINYGRLLMTARDWTKADEILTRASILAETNAEVFYLLGVTNLRQAKYDEATRLLQNAQRFSPNNLDEVYLRLAEVSSETNNINEAITYLNESLKLNPNYFEALGFLGDSYLKINAKDQAISNFSKQLAITKDKKTLSQIHVQIGDAQRESASQEAFSHYQDAINLDRKNAKAYFGIAEIYTDSNKSADAMRFYLQATKADPRFPTAYRQLGFLYSEQNNRPAALKAFQQYLRLAPDAKDRQEINDQIGSLR